jgi:predicted metal-dependent phosphoesterase TrpH
LLKADFHVHTKYSMDCNTPLEKIVSRCLKIGVNCIAICDHGTTEGALRLRDMAPFTVIVAEEIMTQYGEIIGMFLKETIPSRLPVRETISQIRAQGGLVCIPHPFDILRQSALRSNILEEIVEQIDIIEVFNSRTIIPQNSAKALAFATKHSITKGAGSDAHTPREIGRTYIEMPEFEGKNNFLQALERGKISRHITNPFIHFASAWTRLRKKRQGKR